MITCQSHWLEFRDRYEADYTLIAASMAINQVLLDSKLMQKTYGDVYKMEQAINAEGKCPVCFYRKHVNSDVFPAINKSIKEMPSATLQRFKDIDKQAREKNQ